MKQWFSLLLLTMAALLGLPAHAEKLDGVLPLARDDIAAVAQIRNTPDRHVLLYFGDHLN